MDLLPVRKIEGQPDWLDPLTVYGYEFVMDGKVIGAVSLVNKGEVRLVENTGPEVKLVASALATGLLLRHSPADTQG